ETAGKGGGAAGFDSRQLATYDDDTFERAITYSRSLPGHLGRAKVLRSCHQLTGDPAITDLESLLRSYAERGYTSDQIAEEIGKSDHWVRRRVANLGVELPGNRARGKRTAIDSTRIIRETATGLAGTVSALDLLDLSTVEISDDLVEWTASIGRSLRAIQRKHRQLKEKVNGNESSS